MNARPACIHTDLCVALRLEYLFRTSTCCAFLHILDLISFSKPQFKGNNLVTCSVCFYVLLPDSETVTGCVFVVYHALYLEELTAHELTRKISNVLNLPLTLINQVYRQGPTGIHILLSDQVTTAMHIISIDLPLFSVPLLLSESSSLMYDFHLQFYLHTTDIFTCL